MSGQPARALIVSSNSDGLSSILTQKFAALNFPVTSNGRLQQCSHKHSVGGISNFDVPRAVRDQLKKKLHAWNYWAGAIGSIYRTEFPTIFRDPNSGFSSLGYSGALLKD